MNVAELIRNAKGRNFSMEVLPPLKGSGTQGLFKQIDSLTKFNPLFINITNHHSEYVFAEQADGHYIRRSIRRRPGSVAIAAAIQRRYDTPVIPHIICSGMSADDIEYELIDLQILGIENLLLLRGDKSPDEKRFTPVAGGYSHTTELIEQVNMFNDGVFIDGSEMKSKGKTFTYGVACYPEKHSEAPNMEIDLRWLKMKQDLGAQYAVTQLFYDNDRFFAFVDKARAMGVTIPIIPGLKPFTKLQQLSVIPKTFNCDLPKELADKALSCANDDEARRLGVEWCARQCEQLYGAGYNIIHFYTMAAVDSVGATLEKVLG